MNTPDTTTPDGPVPALRAHYLALLTPLILTHMLQSAGGLLDGFWLGHLLGVRGIATAASFYPVFFLLLSLIIGLGAGSTILAGQAWGARDVAQVRRVGATAFLASLGMGLAVALAGAWSSPWLMQALGTPPDILPTAIGYARAMFLVMPLVFVVWAGLSLSRGTGDALSPMWALLAATLVGAVCTPLLVAGTPLGAAGVAVSALVAQLAALTVLIRRWRLHDHPLAPGAGWQDWKPSATIARRMLRIGLPASLQMLAMALAEIVLLSLVNRHGSSSTAAYGAAMQVLSWVQFPAMSLGIAAAILSAHAVGAGRRDRLPAIVRTGLRLNALVTALFVAAAHLLAPFALRVFLEPGPVLEQAVAVVRTVAWGVVLLGWSNVLVSAMRASGAALVPALLSMAAIIGIELPVAVALEARFGLAGVFWACPAAFLAMLVLHGLYYRHKEKKDGLFRQPSVAIGAAGDRAPGA
ncbi:MATE family efflux transporter [Variovorax sp. PAMC28562]|uniref:MATE family efflux transporter n=1 Tax=Variovorax sp. PAMC28562 TaxID=2762323 RepID=UPI00164E6A9B|nr:MATE family efflux transporter [Variovorax sp. PAMC28562]QNK74064.1 MATE family efflux transporter [Variovorax sp. PAMC28562]